MTPYVTKYGRSLPVLLKEIREQAGLTQQQVADALGYNVSHLGDMERGHQAVSQSCLEYYGRLARE